jgi:hypothetical protein
LVVTTHKGRIVVLNFLTHPSVSHKPLSFWMPIAHSIKNHFEVFGKICFMWIRESLSSEAQFIVPD